MKNFVLILAALALCTCNDKEHKSSAGNNQQRDLVQFINPLIGSESTMELSNGNTYPAVALPHGMCFWTPQTAPMGDGWIYGYQDTQIRGLRATHQPSPWVNDYGPFSLMPIAGKLATTEEERASGFSHQQEMSGPHYYQVDLHKYDISAEMTPTERCAYFRFEFPDRDSTFLIVDAFNMGSMVKFIPEENKLIGYSSYNHGGVPENFKHYFVVKFDTPVREIGTWTPNEKNWQSMQAEAEHVGAFVLFENQNNEPVTCKVATSFISWEQAEKNMQQEIGNLNFDEVERKARETWTRELEKIKIEGSTGRQDTVFYTALYRTLLFPRKLYELNDDQQPIYYSPYNGKMHEGYMLTDNGFWDTFRAVHPFFTLMYPEFSNQYLQSLINAYNESGWLPHWSSPGHRDIMIGDHAASLFADAYVKGIRDWDVETAYQAMVKEVNTAHPYFTDIGREEAEEYKNLGYVPYPKYKEATAKTMEYAYNDWNVAVMADSMGKTKDAEYYYKRSMNYKNVWDPETLFMRGRTESGDWHEPFNPIAWGGEFVEGNAWHYLWSVFHDTEGLIELLGGRDKFLAKMDSVFAMPPVYDVGTYNKVIHEITEMVIADMGQYAHGNQPIQHMIYLYNYAGKPWKAQEWTRHVMDSLYGSGPDGLCGDEDNGQTSAWYVFSAMGFYPVTPGHPSYVFGSPLFSKITLQLPDDKEFIIEALNNSPENKYIQSVQLNGEAYDKTWISHFEIVNGGTLTFEMGSDPNKKWGSDPSAAPYSLSFE